MERTNDDKNELIEPTQRWQCVAKKNIWTFYKHFNRGQRLEHVTRRNVSAPIFECAAVTEFDVSSDTSSKLLPD